MLERAVVVDAFWQAVVACDPSTRVRTATAALERPRGRRLGLAIGKAAIAMARGAGEVDAGLAIVPANGVPAGTSATTTDLLPSGWQLLASAHPLPDARSLAAAAAARALLATATTDDQVLALISGGTSSLLEEPRGGITLDDLRDLTARVMAAGATIGDLNTVRTALSAVKAGGLVAGCAAPVLTLAVSDVVGDSLATIGSGPTIAIAAASAHDAALRGRARDLLRAFGIAIPRSVTSALAADAPWTSSRRTADEARVILPMSAFARAGVDALAASGIPAHLHDAPLTGTVDDVARSLASATGPLVAWGEPVLTVPPGHGEGGRAQHLALLLSRALAGTDSSALVVGSDGIDGPPPVSRPAPAGAFVDGTTWSRIAAPESTLARCDAGPALDALDALVITGPTGINHADIIVLG